MAFDGPKIVLEHDSGIVVERHENDPEAGPGAPWFIYRARRGRWVWDRFLSSAEEALEVALEDVGK